MISNVVLFQISFLLSSPSYHIMHFQKLAGKTVNLPILPIQQTKKKFVLILSNNFEN